MDGNLTCSIHSPNGRPANFSISSVMLCSGAGGAATAAAAGRLFCDESMVTEFAATNAPLPFSAVGGRPDSVDVDDDATVSVPLSTGSVVDSAEFGAAATSSVVVFAVASPAWLLLLLPDVL